MMRNLPYDHSRYQPSQPCQDKGRCARFTSPHNPDGWQSCIDASVLLVEGEQCGMFESNERDE